MKLSFDLGQSLEALVRDAASTLSDFDDSFEPEVRTADPRFGDYQANGVLPYAKKQKTNPRALATQLVEALKQSADYDENELTLDIAGPGFINFRFSPTLIQQWLEQFQVEADFQKGAGTLNAGRKIIIDYPSPNTAKQMHIGHLRPIAIGEAVQRMLRFTGAEVIRDNHIGDWGTNFGTIIMTIKREGYQLDPENPAALVDIEELYKAGSLLEKEDPTLRDLSRNELVKLQNGDPENVALWEKIVAVSNKACQEIYDTLNITLDLTLGESFYRDKVDRIYEELDSVKMAEESEGALVVWHDEEPRFSRDAEHPMPFMIRKSDGASNYASTDLATILYRVEEHQANEVVYVTDGRQQDHFTQLFMTTRKWFEKKNYSLPAMRHVWFGTILGEDGKAIKTKSGQSIKLKELLKEATERAYKVVQEKNSDLSDDEKQNIARVVGLGAIRYADLSPNRTANYTFAWDKLLAFEGNTAPYLLYAVARIHSIFRKVDLSPEDALLVQQASPCETEQELALARKIIEFPYALKLALGELRPHFLCNYLFELAGQFSTFYVADKVIGDDPAVQSRRLILCARTMRMLETGLHLLGIETLERM